ncbi:hypothetical protein Q765_03285 [Flavobacterium rivuli WB 3.3-2 = DSM 21788]|uniref:Uncharacterized protein n=1 Tax=Flavobacterium rivuli WB 3.3-2 = DSM 21788 TaxID=1121895 RepID=A0A0A2M8X7_9FLAO|nr:hypothetical protein [Flavobacterium rivuli]KGO88091.1 hypothetical protein Q765_03285 [Flavobacterium rivuli WB 3.3-2 = DSM 21788]
MNVKAILTGWKNYISKSDVVESVAKERAAICAVCPHAKQGKIIAFIKDTLQEVQGAYCDACGCPLSAKIRSTEICPNSKW